jgi:predicted transcriptional regulator
MRGEGMTAAAIEKQANISRPSFYRIRKGQDVRLSTMLRVLRAVRAALGRRVRMDEIFDLDPE